QASVRPLTNVSFSIAVGTAIPADVQLHALPPALVEILPEYRDYSFIVVEQEALIIDPNARTIIAVIPFQAQQTTGVNTAPAPAQAEAPPARERRKHERHTERHHKKDKQVITEERSTPPKDNRVTIHDRPTTTGA